MKISTTRKMVLFCIALVFVRITVTGHFTFLFLIWNLFLAWLPCYFMRKYFLTHKRIAQIGLFAGAILFLPNAPYILTDLFHLSKNLVAPQWFDLILILSFSFTGLIYFIKCCDHVFTVLRSFIVSDLWFGVVRILILISNGYGIYLGRYLRFNSWDVVTDPGELVNRMFISVFHPDHFKETFAVTLTFAVFLYLILEMYGAIKRNNLNDDLSQGS